LVSACAQIGVNVIAFCPGATIKLALGADVRGVILTVDGQWACSFLPGDTVELTEAEQPLMLFASEQSFFDVMRDKLHWGVRNDRGHK